MFSLLHFTTQTQNQSCCSSAGGGGKRVFVKMFLVKNSALPHEGRQKDGQKCTQKPRWHSGHLLTFGGVDFCTLNVRIQMTVQGEKGFLFFSLWSFLKCTFKKFRFPVGFSKLHNQFWRRLKRGVFKGSFNNLWDPVSIIWQSDLPDNAGYKKAKVYSLIVSDPLLALRLRASQLALASHSKRNTEHHLRGEAVELEAGRNQKERKERFNK